jgi:hypothetical protein
MVSRPHHWTQTACLVVSLAFTSILTIYSKDFWGGKAVHPVD